MTSSLDVRAGLTPGSLLIKSRDARSHRVVMVPPAERPCHFQVLPLQLNGQPNGFALIRVQQPVWPAAIINETLFEFNDKAAADGAFQALEDALVRDEGGGDESGGVLGGHREGAVLRARAPRATVAVLLLLVVAAAAVVVVSRSHTATDTPSAAAPQAAIPALSSATHVASSQPEPASDGPQAQASPIKAPPDQAPASPGDAFVQAAGDPAGR